MCSTAVMVMFCGFSLGAALGGLAAAFQRASGDDAHAVIQGALPASGQSQRVLRVGIDHAF